MTMQLTFWCNVWHLVANRSIAESTRWYRRLQDFMKDNVSMVQDHQYYLVSSLDLSLWLPALFTNMSWRTRRSWQTWVTLGSYTDKRLKQSYSGDNSSGTWYPSLSRREWLAAGRTHTFSPLGPWKFNPMFPWGQVTQHCGLKQLQHLRANGNNMFSFFHDKASSPDLLQLTFGPGGPGGPGGPWKKTAEKICVGQLYLVGIKNCPR